MRSGTDVIGSHTRVKVVKNKVAPPFKEAEFDILYGEGISNESCIIDLAVENNIIEKSGSWFAYKGQKIAQGKDNARLYLKEHTELRDEIVKLIRESYEPCEQFIVEDEAEEYDDSMDNDDDILGIDL